MGSASSVDRRDVGRCRSYLRECLRIDTRALAVFRIVAAVLILADLFLRARNFSYFYTDQGVVPRSLAMDALPVEASVYFLTGSPVGTAALFVLHGLIAVQLLIGYRTRIATALSLVFVLSLDLRNPLVLSYADTLFAWLLFWAIFLPLGERWSVDAVHVDREPRQSVAGVASALILGQMVTMYVVNGYHKSESELWTSGEAAALVLGLDDMTFLLADVVRSAPTLLEVGGLAWYYMLAFAWVLLLVRGRLRTALVAPFLFAHLSFAVTVRIGAFAFVAIAGLLLFLQAPFWDGLRGLLKRLGVPVAGVATRLSRLQAVATYFPQRQPVEGIVGRLSGNPRRTALAAGLALFTVFALVAVLSAGGLVADDVDPAATAQQGAVGFVDHQTEWSIFAPTPRTTDRYYVFPARTESGERIDVYNERPLTYDRPAAELQTQYETYRERFYMNSVRTGDPPATPERLAEHVCAEWNTDRDDELTHVNMYVVEEDVTRETIDDPADRDRDAFRIHRHGCGDREPTDIEPPTR
ncbi:HTTM domain-containing protein [Natronolimnohabitans sp. A-GB9]|uniref:HTTM domain-containing protein n=1 Tax=Natronolimnohabitans sp. A-GB9 TaxID=3069757 RepID=UPI0027B05A75|nr:HTTM domain-containing protein [Natronolimnohabitans sp. A-GB9]MDQ2050579.1 HTTM domain-containing protein [Natronolimnohabitans sp. A-GB9]